MAKAKKGLPEIVPMPDDKPMQSQSLLGYSVLVDITLKNKEIKQAFYDPRNKNWKLWGIMETVSDKDVKGWEYPKIKTKESNG